MSRTLGCAALLVGLGVSACNNQTPPPLMASAAGQSTYAVAYPEDLSAVRTEFTDQESQITKLSGELAGFPAAIETKKWEHVTATYRLADEAGKSEDYGERYDQNQQVDGFVGSQKEKLNQSLVNSVGYIAKQNECKEPGEVAGTAVVTWNKAVDKQLREQLRSHSEAHSYIEGHAEAIGTKTADKLRDQADTISELSYLANVGLERSRRRLRSMLEQSADIRSTLDKVVEEAEEQSRNSAEPAGDRKAAETRARFAKTAREKLDGEVSQAKSLDEQLDTKFSKIRDDYEKAFSALLDAAEEKTKTATK